MPNRGKSGFNRIAGAAALPMLGGAVEECYEFSPILLQAQCRFGLFGFVDFDEQIKGLVRVVLGRDPPDIVYASFTLWLGAVRRMRLKHNMARFLRRNGWWEFVEPATSVLFAGIADDLYCRAVRSQPVGHEDMRRTKAMQQQRAVVCALHRGLLCGQSCRGL